MLVGGRLSVFESSEKHELIVGSVGNLRSCFVDLESAYLLSMNVFIVGNIEGQELSGYTRQEWAIGVIGPRLGAPPCRTVTEI